jgi:hypothetical protein
MIARALEHRAADILFRLDFQNEVTGNLLPGTSVTVLYDAERLPYERSMEGMSPAWSISAYVKFAPQGPARAYPLWTRTGMVLTGTKQLNDPGEGTMLQCEIDIPADAQYVEMWFVNTGKSGQMYYDSAYGHNYVFRFTTQDIQVVSATVMSSYPTPYSRFDLTVSAAADVTAVAALYWTNNINPAQKGQVHLAISGAGPAPGWQTWQGDQIVPYQAVIMFDAQYIAEGRTFVDDNSGRHFLAQNVNG